MITFPKITGLVAAPHTPFHADGSLNLSAIEKQTAHLLQSGVRYAFIGGTTGECSSLTIDERKTLIEHWLTVTHGTPLQVIVHVGANSLDDGCALAVHASRFKAHGISAVAPCYFKPSTSEALARSMAKIAAAAPDLPFYYYEIPSMTGLAIPPSAFLSAAVPRIPTLAGIKFTSSNLMEYQLCRNFHDGALDIPFGFDEMLLAALALGAQGAVGSSFNFAAPVYLEMIKAFQHGDLDAAREYQWRSVRFIEVLSRHGYMPAAKSVMEMLGVPVGPPRLPFLPLNQEQKRLLREELETMGFFDWVRS